MIVKCMISSIVTLSDNGSAFQLECDFDSLIQGGDRLIPKTVLES